MKMPFKLAVALVCAALTAFGVETKNGAVSDSRTEANIVWVASRVLENSQFSHHPLDNELAGRLLDGYLDALDGGRMLFIQSDMEEFARFRATLAHEIRSDGDTSVAHSIFSRYLQRLGQQAAYMTNALQTNRFQFAGHDTFPTDRKEAARPADLAAARALWRQRLRFDYLQEKLDGKKADEIVNLLSRRYARLFRIMTSLKSDEVMDAYLNALAHVYDPHSDYLPPEELDSFAISMSLSLTGIGASLQSEDGYCRIGELVPGGPAARNGELKPGDRIVAVGQGNKEPVDIVDMPLPRAVELIRGPKGSVVRLVVKPASAADVSARKTISIVRDEIKLEDQQARGRIIDLPSNRGNAVRVGVIDLPSFYADDQGSSRSGHFSASADVARLLRKLKSENVRGVILDLRRNGGGSLQESVDLTGLFIRKGPVVQTRGPNGDIEINEDTDSSVIYGGPLIVLTSRFSASASEIVAGALQDYGRALVVGDSSTFGKGTVQAVVGLAPFLERSQLGYGYDPGALKVTVRKFYRPSGASTQLKGVAADIVLPSPSDLSDVSESALKNPLPWDSVPAANYKRLNWVQPYLEVLREKSARRVSANEDFKHLREDTAVLKKNLAAKAVSLNEADRRREREEALARAKEREQEAAKDRNAEVAEYEITVKNAGRSGLPTPMARTNRETAFHSASNAVAESPDIRGTGSSPEDDIVLGEAERILADYAEMLAAGTGAVPRRDRNSK